MRKSAAWLFDEAVSMQDSDTVSPQLVQRDLASRGVFRERADFDAAGDAQKCISLADHCPAQFVQVQGHEPTRREGRKGHHLTFSCQITKSGHRRRFAGQQPLASLSEFFQ